MNTKPGIIKLKKVFQKNSIVFFAYVFLLLMVIISLILRPKFLGVENLKNLIENATPYIFVAFAQTIVILTGGIDLSVGSIVCLANVIFASLANNGPLGIPFAFVVSMTVAIGAGLLNGLAVTIGRLPPLIVTLASSSIFAGLALAILPQPGGKVPVDFSRVLTGDTVLGIPVPLLIIVIITVILWNLLNNTKYGYGVYAVGGNEDSAFYTGVPINKIKLMTYVISGVLSAIGGMFIAVQMVSGDPLIGLNLPLISVTTVVIGGTSLLGGKGGIIGTIAGVFVIIIINNMLNLLGVPSFYQYIFQGSILILALAVSSISTNKSIDSNVGEEQANGN